MIYLAAAIPVIVIIVKLVLNIKAWHARKPVKHFIEWLIMAAACVPSIIIFTNESSLATWLAAGVSAGMIAFFIWLFFDGFYNVLRGYGWFFTGSDDKDDAKTDDLLQRLPLWLHIVIKIGTLIALLTVYILNYGRFS